MDDIVELPYSILTPITLEPSRIPRNFIQTFRDNRVHKAVYDNVKCVLNLHPGFNYMLITDAMGIELMEKHFDPNILNAFKKLKAGAAKGDFIRYIALYIYGGMYLDMDSCINRDMSEFLDRDFVWCYDNSYNIIQWFFMISPRHSIMKRIIEEMVIRISRYEENIFIATGPTLVSDVIFGFLDKTLYYNTVNLSDEVKHKIIKSNKWGGVICFEDPKYIQFRFPGYVHTMLYDQNNPRYAAYLLNGKTTPDLYV